MIARFIAFPIALLLGTRGMLARLYCIGREQNDDLETLALRILVEDSMGDDTVN